MAFGKTAEQRNAEDQERAAAAYWASPVGRAQTAKQAGAVFFQVEIPHSTIGGYANAAWGSGTVHRVTPNGGAPDMLGQIEQMGWHLEHASWVFVQTGQSSRDKIMSSGQSTAVTGDVIGIYLFRNIG